MQQAADEILRQEHGLTEEEVRKAQDWWANVSDELKSAASIWFLLALYRREAGDQD